MHFIPFRFAEEWAPDISQHTFSKVEPRPRITVKIWHPIYAVTMGVWKREKQKKSAIEIKRFKQKLPVK